MIQILHPNEICSEVLSLKVQVKKKYDGLPLELNELLKDIQIPVFKSFELMRIKKELTDKNVNMVTVLKQHKFTFCFLPDQIERFINSPNYTTDYTNFLAAYIFYSYLAFEIITQTCTDQLILIDFFRFFNFIAQENRFSINPNYRKIALNFAYFGFQKYLQNSVEDTLQDFLPQLNDFFFYNTDLPPFCFEILVHTANVVFSSSKISDPEKRESFQTNFLTIADGLIQQIKQYFPPSVAKDILQRSFSSIRKLDISALSFFYHSCDLIDKSVLSSCVYLFPPAVMSLLSGSDAECFPPTETHKHFKIVTNDVPENAFQPTSESNLDESDLNLQPKFPKQIPLETLFPKKLESQIAFLTRLLVSNSVIASSFIEASAPFIIGCFEQENYLSLYVVFLYFYMRIRSRFNIPLVESTLFNLKIFNPNIVVFDEQDDFGIINTVRDICFQLILKDDNPNCCYMIRHILLDSYIYPLLYAELVSRLVVHSKPYLHNIIFVSNIVMGLMKPMTVYQSFQKNKFPDQIIDEVKIARKSIITFLCTYLADPMILCSFMSNDYFAKSFFCLIFEEPLREVVMTFITVFMSDIHNKENIIIDQLIQIMILTFSSPFIKSSNPKMLAIPARILQCVNTCLRAIPCLVTKFEQIVDPVLQSIIGIKGNNHEEFLIQFILLLVFLTPIHLLKPHEAAALLKASSQLGKQDPSQKLSRAVIQLIAGRELSIKPEEIIVKQPHALTLYLNIYIESQFLIDCTHNLYTILSNSQANCIKAHDGELDLFCINLLERTKSQSEVKMDIVNSLLDIVDLISRTISSVSVVQSYISLFCPVEGRFLSKFHMNLIDFVDRKILAAYYTPQHSYALLPNNYIEIHGLTSQHIQQGFCFSFWFFPVKTDIHIPLLTIQDSNDAHFTIIYTNQVLKIEFASSSSKKWSNPALECVPINKWTFVSVQTKLYGDASTCSCLLMINNVIVFEERDIPSFHFKKGPLDVTINYGVQKIHSQMSFTHDTFSNQPINNNDFENPSKIGPFILMTSDDFQIYKQGPRKFVPPKDKTILAFKPVLDNGKFYFKNLLSEQDDSPQSQQALSNSPTFATNFEVYAQKSKVKNNPTFIDILIESCKFTLLLPLFAQIDMCEINGQKKDDLIFKLISMTKNALLLSQSVRVQFQEKHAFSIIEHLLSVSDEKNITYKLYLSFYDLMVDLPVNDPIREELFDNIIMNPAIWIKATPHENKQILMHWITDVCKKVPSFVFQMRGFQWWIDTLHSFYWFIPNELSLQIKRFQGMRANVHKLRSYLIECALHVATFQFIEKDFAYLITAIISINDMQQIVSLLSMLKNLLSGSLFNFFNHDFLLAQFFRLHCLFKVSHPILFKNTVELLMFAHERKFIDITKSEHFQFIFNTLLANASTKPLLNRAVLMMKEYPEILPIPCLIAFNCGTKAIGKLSKNLRPNPDLKQKNVNYTVLIALLFKARPLSKLQKIIDFLLLSYFDDLQTVYTAIEIVGCSLSCHDSIDDIKSLFLLKACQICLEQPSHSPANLIKLSLNFLFVHPREKGNALMTIYNNSPFIETENTPSSVPSSTANPKLKHMTPQDANNLCSKVADYKYKVNLRFSGDAYTWSDIKLAINIVSIILSTQVETTIEYASVLCAFLIRSTSNSAPSVPDVMQDPLLQGLICYEQTKKGAPVINEMSEVEFTKNAFDALERFFQKIDVAALKTSHAECANEMNAIHQRTAQIAQILAHVPSLKPHLTPFIDIVEEEEQVFARYWQTLWRSVTTQRAPWNKSLPKDMSVVHFKRDNNYCVCFCPFKLRRNYNFDDHMQASFVRDSGNDDDAKVMLENYRAENFALLSKIAPAQILEIDDSNTNSVKQTNTLAPDANNGDNTQNSAIMTKSLEIKNCALVKPSRIREITFKISYDRFLIKGMQDGKMKTILFKNLKYVLRRTFCHHPTAIEFFTNLRTSYFIDFRMNVDKIMNYFKTAYVPRDALIQNTIDFKQFFLETNKTNLWLERKISNFEYLMYLNVFSGRSFNSPSQYPFFPWILKNYTSEKLNLNDPSIYRDLSLPIGATNPERFKELVKKCRELQSMGLDPYLFSSGQICPLSLYLWLMRMEPFTTLHIEIQGGKFDHAARIFSSIVDSFRVVTTHMNNFRELIPEFFFCPEFLLNMNNFDLGKMDNVQIGDVVLPPWAKDAFEFVYFHRKALESEYVSQNIHNWIDITWGVKQRSENNLYKAEMYADIWDRKNLQNTSSGPSSGADQQSSEANDIKMGIEAVLSQVGQQPPQLFTTPHPKRKPKFAPAPSISRPATIEVQMKHMVFSIVLPGISGKYWAVLINQFGFIQKCRLSIRRLLNPTQSAVVAQSQASSSNAVYRNRSMTVTSDKSHPTQSSSYLDFAQVTNGNFEYIHSGTPPQQSLLSGYTASPIPTSSSNSSSLNKLSQSPPSAQQHQLAKQSQVPHGVKLKGDSVTDLTTDKIGVLTKKLFTMNGSDILFVGSEGTNLYLLSIDMCNVKDLIHHTCEIVGIASDSQWIAIAGRDARICLFRSTQFYTSISTYCDSIRCLTMSSDFDTLVCGTKDGALLFCTLSRGEVVRVVDLNGKVPKSVLITKGMGFVLVYADALVDGQLSNHLILYNINGMKIREKRIDSAVRVWDTWKRNDGFDFVLMINEKGNTFVFEAFFINIGSVTYRCKGKIVNVKAIPEQNVGIAFTETAQILVFPFTVK